MTSGALIVFATACLLSLVAGKPSDSRTPPGDTENGDELTYTYHSRTMVIGQKDFEIEAKFRVVCGGKSAAYRLCELTVDALQLVSEDSAQPPVLYPGGSRGSSSLDLSGRFFYEQLVSGDVVSVYHDKDEHQDISALKRAFVVMITGHMKNTVQSYEVEETDNQGKHVSSYVVKPGENDFQVYSKLKHQHQQESYTHFFHKVMHVKERKQVHLAIQNETFELRNEGNAAREPFIPEHIRRYAKPLPDGTESGEMVKLHAGSNSSVTLVSIKKVPFDSNPRILGRLERQSIITKMKKTFMPPENFEEKIEEAIACMAEKLSPESSDFRTCYGYLVDILEELPDEQLKDIAAVYLAPALVSENSLNATAIVDALDAVAMNRQIGQELLVKHVFRCSSVRKEIVVRALHVCYTVKEPSRNLINAIHDLAFNGSLMPETLRGIDVQQRATLAYGALARSLARVDPVAANVIVHQIETAANNVPPVVERTVRSVHSSLVEGHWHELHYHKMVLLHSLGNAGIDRSKSLLISHLDGNGPSIWKRAAVTALGQYSCEESANVLLKTLSNEEEETVWDEALTAYQRHPRRNNNSLAFCLEERLRNDRKFKRRSIADFLKKLNFKLELPEVDWAKQIGSRSLGASFGIRLKNKMELSTEQLSTKFEIVVRDAGWVTAHLGILNINVDVLRAEACYHGHVSYDLNILKDFGIDFTQGLADTFEQIKDSVVGSIQRAIDAFRKIVCKGCLKEIFNNFVNSIVDIPRLVVNLRQALRDALLAMEEFVGLPWMRPIVRVVRRVKGIADSIQSDILDTFKSVGDAITVQLPYAGNLLEEAFLLIGETVDHFFKAPLQSIGQLARAVSKIQQSVILALHTRDEIKEKLHILSRPPYWMELGEEFELLWDDITDAYTSLKALWTSRQNAVANSPFGAISRERGEDFVIQKVKDILSGVFKPLEALKNLAAPFVEAYNSVIDVINQVKTAFSKLKETYENVRSLVVKVFGPKFYKKFPRKRRPCSPGGCGCGGFPSTGDGRFDEGVDVLIGEKAQVVAPIAGKAKSTSSGQVTITAEKGPFSEKVIIIDDVVANASLSSSQEVYAGQVIGRAGRSSCQPNSLHVVVKAPSSFGKLAPVDPTPYLDRIELPSLNWIQECDEYKLVLLGFTLSSGKLSDAAKQAVSDIKRGENPFRGTGKKVQDAVNNAKTKVNDAVDQAKDRLKDLQEQVGRAASDIGDAFTSSTVQNSFKTVFPSSGLDIPDYTGPDFGVSQSGSSFDSFGDFVNNLKSNVLNYNPATLTVGSVLDLFKRQGMSAEADSLRNLVGSLKSALDDSSCQAPSTASDKKLRSFLRRQGKKTKGSRYELIQRLNEIPDTVCSGVRRALQHVSGQYCTVDADCLGFSCCTPLRLTFWEKFLKARARLDPCKRTLTLSLGTWTSTFNTSHALEDEIKVGKGAFGDDISVTMAVKAIPDGTWVKVSVTVQLCSRVLRMCVVPVSILHEAMFSTNGMDCGSHSPSDNPTLSSILGMTLGNFQEELADSGIKGFVSTLVAKARGALLENLLNDVGLAMPNLQEEFKKKTDFCQSASWDFPPVTTSFFNYDITTPMGPVVVGFFLGARGAYGTHFELGICVLSSQAKMTVTPWAGIELYGGVRVGIFIFFVEVSIHGHVLQVQFPARATVSYAKMPLDVRGTIDVNLVPLTLSIRASVVLYIKLCFFFCIKIQKTIWSSLLWTYTSPTISTNVLTIGNDDKDVSAPEFRSLIYSSDRKRRSNGDAFPCFVHQVKNRLPATPAFEIEVNVYDDESDVSFQLDIGRYKRGRNVRSDLEMGGPLFLSSESLPSGIPLYFTTKASNSQGISATATCSIPTYDTTPPGGRVEQSYDISSHPFTLSALLVVHDDSELEDKGRVSVGFGAGKSNVIAWYDFSFNAVGVNHLASDNLAHFATPRLGRLTAPAVAITTVITPLKCATFCLSHGVQCVSFDYNYGTAQCVVLQAIEGELVKREVSGSFHNFERIGIGHTAWFEHVDMTLNHGETYYFNIEAKNVLGYTQLMTSKGTLIDFSPPLPGNVGDAELDVIVASQCTASFLQRCTDVTPWPNHRIIIDGKGGETVFNGHEPFTDLLYTRYNNFIACNFRGFHDEESDIYKYAWGAGTQPLNTDVFDYEDPHGHLHDERHWTQSGTKLVDLLDGHYFLTVQAVNTIVFGGSLVTEVGHSTPYIVDTTPPTVHSVHGLEYDEVTHILRLEYNTSDAMSGVREVDFALGRTVHDTELHSWERHGNLTMLLVRIGVEDGIPTWVRIRAIDNVYLMAVGHSHHPLVIDRSPPVVGYVYDGFHHGHDIQYVGVNDTMCVNWDKFHDEQSGLAYFAEVGVGSSPGMTDVVPLQQVHYKRKEICLEATLLHGHSYYSMLIVYNQGHKQQSVNESSNGVVVDLTDPISGWAKDGLDPVEDVSYSYIDSAVDCNWNGFYDPESDIVSYEVQSFVSGVPSRPRAVGLVTQSTDTSISLRHGDHVRSVVTAINGADRRSSVATNSYIIDKSPPDLMSIKFEGSRSGIPFFQADVNMIVATWAYSDPESGIMSYKVAIHELHHGSNHPIYPKQGDWADFPKQGKDGSVNRLVVSNLSLRGGAEYVVKVTATNHAKLSVIHTSAPVTVDNTPPSVAWIVVGNLDGSDEDVDDMGRIVHSDLDGMQVSWFGSDPESGIDTYLVAIGTSVRGTDTSGGWRDVGSQTSTYVGGLTLSLTDHSSGSPVYYVTVKARNRAGLVSQDVISKAVFVVKADVPGVVLDGADTTDATFQGQAVTVTAQFTSFSSERCGGIATHEWAIGTEALQDDLQPFTSVGIVVRQDGSGFSQMPFQLQNGQTIYSTIKATTGCGNELISSSSGVTPDITAPEIQFTQFSSLDADNVSSISSLYVYSVGSVGVAWQGEDEESGVSVYRWSSSSVPAGFDTGTIVATTNTRTSFDEVLQQSEGIPSFFWAEAENAVGYKQSDTSVGLVVDSSPPLTGRLRCPADIADSTSELRCCWEDVTDSESGLLQFRCTMTSSDGVLVSAATSMQDKYTSCCLLPLIKNNLLNGSYLVTLEVVNGIQLSSFVYATVAVDTSPPTAGKVRHLSDEYHLLVDGNDTVKGAVQCQAAETNLHVLWDPFVDMESPMARYEVAVGEYPGSSSLRSFESVGLANSKRIDYLQLQHGVTAYVSVRGFNKAGLSAISVSSGVVINSKTRLSVRDGLLEDIDFQPSASVISASWVHDSACPVANLSWGIYEIDGTVIQPLTRLPNDASSAIAERVSLSSGNRYYVIVRLKNALGQITIGRSNGVTVDIEPPVPGEVLDGPDAGVDLNYQASVTTLSASWRGFGRAGSPAPGQQIAKYVVALGSDDRYSVTRRNVVPFTDVGLNTSITFRDLDLIPHSQQYFFTVRAYGKTGATAEVTSNGIYVGFGEPLLPGSVHVKRFSDSSSFLTASWDGFSSDLPILFFEWAISSAPVKVSQCPQSVVQYVRNEAIDRLFDVQPFVDVGLDTVATSTHLNLSHSRSYYITVRATNEALSCISAVSLPVVVDLTPPRMGVVTVGVETDLGTSYIQASDELGVTWRNFSDPESGVSEFRVALLGNDGCSQLHGALELKTVLDYVSVGTDTSYLFQALSLESFKPYYVSVIVNNGAGLNVTVLSKPVLVDATPPFVGDLKDGVDWTNDQMFQSSLDTLEATATVAFTESQVSCPDRNYDMRDRSALNDWTVYTGDSVGNIPNYGTLVFEPGQVSTDRLGLKLGWVRDLRSVRLRSGAIYTKAGRMEKSRFVVEMKAAKGNEALTSVVLWDGYNNEIVDFEASLTKDGNASNSINQVNVSYSSVSGSGSGSEPATIDPDLIKLIKNQSDHLDSERGELEYARTDAGLGLQVFGERQRSESDFNRREFYLLFWCRFSEGEQLPKLEWVELGFDPSSDYHTYVIQTRQEQIQGSSEWVAQLYIDDELRAVLNGVPELRDNASVSIAVRTHNGYVPRLTDPFHAPSAFAYIRRVRLPVGASHPCHYGQPFGDFESPIVSTEACVSSEHSGSCDVLPFHPQRSPCFSCRRPCDRYSCSTSCQLSDLSVSSFKLSNLTLIAGTLTPSADGSESSQLVFRPSVYYFVLRLVNAAGGISTSVSDGVVIDATVAVCTAVYQVDPSWSLTEPALYQGSNTTIAALWQCGDNISDIVEYSWAIGTNVTSQDIQPYSSVDLATSALKDGLTLTQGATYSVAIRVQNGAHMYSTWYGDGITVDVEPPDVVNTNVTSLFSKTFLDVSDTDRITRGDRLGIAWTEIGDPDVDKIDWSVHCVEKGSEIVPPITVSVGPNASSAEVIDGKIVIGQTESLNLSDVKALEQNTFQEKQLDRNFLNVEPGRLVYNTLLVYSKAHKKSILPGPKVAFIRSQDVVLTGSSLNDRSNDSLLLPVVGESAHERNVTVSGLVIRDGGAVVLGSLTKEDLVKPYGSSAVNDYMSYIRNPVQSRDDTSRRLASRFQTFLGTSFFVAPFSPGDISGPVTVSVPFNSSLSWGDEIPEVLFWDPKLSQWRLAGYSSCPYPTRVDWTKGVLSVQVCGTWTSPVADRERRSTSGVAYLGHPTQFVLASIKSQFVNTAPTIPIPDLRLSLDEDDRLSTRLLYSDQEHDNAVFHLVDEQSHILSDVSLSDDGLLEVVPCGNCYGSAMIRYMVTEIDLPEGRPLSAEGRVYVTVEPKEDAPLLYYATIPVGEVTAVEEGGLVYIPVEQNKYQRTSVSLPVAVFDPDETDNVTLLVKLPPVGNVSLRETVASGNATSPFEYTLLNVTQMPSPAFKEFAVDYAVSGNYFGTVEIQVVAGDQHSSYSNVLTLKIYVLSMPCENDGRCSGNQSDPHCQSLDRAYSYRGYSCICQPGYSGMLCETDVDECSSGPCGFGYDCIDQVNSHICIAKLSSSPTGQLHPGAIAGICVALIVLIAALLVGWIVWRKKKQQPKDPERKTGGVSSSSDNVDVSSSTGNVDATFSSGNVDAAVSAGDVDATVSSGNVDPISSTSAVNATFSSGNVDPAVTDDNVYATVPDGNVDPISSTSVVDANLSSGDVDASFSTSSIDADRNVAYEEVPMSMLREHSQQTTSDVGELGNDEAPEVYEEITNLGGSGVDEAGDHHSSDQGEEPIYSTPTESGMTVDCAERSVYQHIGADTVNDAEPMGPYNRFHIEVFNPLYVAVANKKK